MNHIEKERLIKADIASIENRVRHAFNQGYDLGFKDGKEKAKPQKQEPILDKISEEIKVMISNRGILSYSIRYINKEIDKIFDKYKAEVEPQESGDKE